MLWHEWLSVIAVVLAAVALLLVVLAVTGRIGSGVLGRTTEADRTGSPGSARAGAAGSAGDTVRGGADRAPGQQVAFVVNPTKPGADTLRETALTACAARYLPEPLWFETTEADPGVGQARAALAAGADVVVACGGDGTVRAVAEALVGTGKTMAILPVGTGNLLARNLDLPLGRPEDMLRTALGGTDRTIDVGWLRIVRDGDGREQASAGSRPRRRADEPSDDEHLFLVIAGIGIDAAMVADADEELKKRVGWIAYFFSAARHLHGRRLKMRLRLDDSSAVPAQVRTLLIGNCGRLPGGINLLPDAVIDDGWLDVAALDTRGGVAGWAQLFGTVMLQGVGVRSNDLPGRIGRIDHARARSMRVLIERAEQVQIDGELIGEAREITARVDPGVLIVRGR